MQVCPEATKVAKAAPFTACLISASSNMIIGALPPSSLITPAILAPAAAPTIRPLSKKVGLKLMVFFIH